MNSYSLNAKKLRNLFPNLKIIFENKNNCYYARFLNSRTNKIDIVFDKFMNLPGITINTNDSSLINQEFVDKLNSLFINGLVIKNPPKFLIKKLKNLNFKCLNDYVNSYNDLFMNINSGNYFFSNDLVTTKLNVSINELLDLKPDYLNFFECELDYQRFLNFRFFNNDDNELFCSLTKFLNQPALAYISRSESLRNNGIGKKFINDLLGLFKNKNYSKLIIKEPFDYRINYYESLGAKNDKIPFESLNIYYIPL